MAAFQLRITSIGRNAGRVAAAASRAGERIRGEHSGNPHDHSGRGRVLHAEILLPSHLAGQNVAWARDRSRLWKAAEHAERRTARVAREFHVTLPVELSAEQRLQLARTFSQELADRYRVAVDLAVHEPRSPGDSRSPSDSRSPGNPDDFHAHLLATTREVTPAGLGARAGLDMHPNERLRLGLPERSQEYTAIRTRWAALTDEALRDAHVLADIRREAREAWLTSRFPPTDEACADMRDLQERRDRGPEDDYSI